MCAALSVDAFNLEWNEWSNGYIARFRPPADDSDSTWQYCELLYTLLPTDGRHQDAMYTITVRLHDEPTGTQCDVGESVTTAEFELGVSTRHSDFTELTGYHTSGQRVIEHSHGNTEVAEVFGDLTSYDYMTVRLDYQHEFLAERADAYDSIDDARDRFVEFVDRKNENIGWEKEPTETLF